MSNTFDDENVEFHTEILFKIRETIKCSGDCKTLEARTVFKIAQRNEILHALLI